MSIWSFLRPRTPNPNSILDFAPALKLSPYVGEYLAAIDRTEEFGFKPPMRLIVTITVRDEVRRVKSRFSRPVILRVFHTIDVKRT